MSDLSDKNFDRACDMIDRIIKERDMLHAALTQFVAACETAPPTSLMSELGAACKAAKRALALPSQLHQTGE